VARRTEKGQEGAGRDLDFDAQGDALPGQVDPSADLFAAHADAATGADQAVDFDDGVGGQRPGGRAVAGKAGRACRQRRSRVRSLPSGVMGQVLISWPWWKTCRLVWSSRRVTCCPASGLPSQICRPADQPSCTTPRDLTRCL
jgi:hypothetical protein